MSLKPLVKLTQISDFAPSQWEGIAVDGKVVLVHYRYGVLTVYRFNPGEKWHSGERREVRVGGPLDGTLTTDEMLYVLDIPVSPAAFDAATST